MLARLFFTFKSLRRPTTPWVCLALCSITLLFFAACGSPKPSGNAPVQVVSSGKNEFLGNEACRGCHPNEFKIHDESRHNHTLRPFTKTAMGDEAPPTGSIPNTTYQMVTIGDRYAFGSANGDVKMLDLVFGSGKSGLAFTTVVQNTALAEARISYFPSGKKWYITPGQEQLSEDTLGNVSQGTSARQCVGCHTITVPEHSLLPERKFMGVGCEACHGAGGQHVEAMRQGKKENLFMAKLIKEDGKTIAELCGRCHRTTKDVTAKNLKREHTDLFQAYGLEQSRCYKEGQNKLSCTSCHDPHTSIATDEKSYNQVCLQCHAPANVPVTTRLLQIRPCPVNASDKCVSCHMPKRSEPVFPGSPRKVADHFIRVHKEN